MKFLKMHISILFNPNYAQAFIIVETDLLQYKIMSRNLNIAQRMRIKIRSMLPYGPGGISLPKREARMMMEQIIKSFEGILIYTADSPDEEKHDLFARAEYAFVDGSVIALEGVSYLDTTQPNGNPERAIEQMGGFQYAKAKAKCWNLPVDGPPYDIESW